MSDREEKFEKMMQSVLDSYYSAVEKMDKLKQEGKTNTVTYKQLMAEKLKNQNIISLYKIYGLIEDQIVICWDGNSHFMSYERA